MASPLTQVVEVAGVILIAFSLSPWLPLGFVFLFLAGIGYLASNTSATSRLQRAASARMPTRQLRSLRLSEPRSCHSRR